MGGDAARHRRGRGVCDREIADVRAELARVATFEPVGGDGYWTAAAYRAAPADPRRGGC